MDPIAPTANAASAGPEVRAASRRLTPSKESATANGMSARQTRSSAGDEDGMIPVVARSMAEAMARSGAEMFAPSLVFSSASLAPAAQVARIARTASGDGSNPENKMARHALVPSRRVFQMMPSGTWDRLGTPTAGVLLVRSPGLVGIGDTTRDHRAVAAAAMWRGG